MSNKKITVHLTLVEESTASVEVEANDITEAKRMALTIYLERDLAWQYDQSHVEVDEVCSYDYLSLENKRNSKTREIYKL